VGGRHGYLCDFLFVFSRICWVGWVDVSWVYLKRKRAEDGAILRCRGRRVGGRFDEMGQF